MRIYHGSSHIIEQPTFGLGHKSNDYGLGFYCTEDRDLAREWAVDLARDGYANAYDLNLRGLTVLNLDSPEYTPLHWLAVLVQNRTFDPRSDTAQDAIPYLAETFATGYEDCDVIEGWRADDSYFTFAKDFLDNTISYRRLVQAMRLGDLGRQVVLKSERAFARLSFRGYDVALASEWYERKRSRDERARREYLYGERGRVRGDLYMAQILDEEVQPDDPRLR